LGAIKKLENVTLIDSSKILDAVNAASIAKIIPQQGTNKSAELVVCVFSGTKGSLGQVSVLFCTLSGKSCLPLEFTVVS
jgi:hypothetical protein